MSGGVNLLSDSSLVRVILVDTFGNHYMVFESYPLIISETAFDTISASDETTFMDGVICDSIRIDIISAFLDLDSLILDTNFVSNTVEMQAQAKWDHDSVKIAVMNQRILEEHMYWRAGRSQISYLTNEMKETRFGRKYSLEGYDYYIGGIYQRLTDPPTSSSSSTIIGDFDWRYRHDASVGGSPYYNSEGYGWITALEHQGNTQLCWAYSTTTLEEAYANLFYNNNFEAPNGTNHQLNLDLSEMELVRCYQNNTLNCQSTQNVSNVMVWVKQNYMYDEECFPLDCGQLPNCPTSWPSSCDRMKPSGSFFLEYEDEYFIKSVLINHGPISCKFDYGSYAHQRVLIGYSIAQLGDTVYLGTGPEDPPVILDENCSFIDGTLWIFKDSDQNTFYPLTNLQGLQRQQSFYFYDDIDRPVNGIQTPIKCSDEDGDGYYWWGLHWKRDIYTGEWSPVDPTLCGCPFGVNPDEEDCNDWAKESGPYDTQFNCTPNCEYDGTPEVFSSNSNWYSDKHFNHDIIIRNCTVTIYGATVWMGPDAKIIIERGGKLELLPKYLGPGEYAFPRITAGCNVLWDGIEVWGTSDQGQTTTDQGVLYADHATIEKMKWGIRNFKPQEMNNENGWIPYNGYTGGIIVATNSTFYDNKRSVVFGPYEYESVSQFTDCIFKTDGLLLDGTFANYFIVMYNTQGVHFDGCDIRENSTMNSRKAYGIYAYNSDFVFDGGNSDPNNPGTENFSSLNYGIYAFGSGYNPDFQIEMIGSWFNNNRRSIYVSGITGERIRNNAFWIPKITGDTCYGIYLDHSSSWNMITENVFRSINPTGLRGHVGVYVNYCGGVPKEIYKNSFDHLEYGTVSFGVNRSSEGIGLVYRCNGFSDCLNDIVVLDEPEYPDGGIFESCMGIAYCQGDMDDVAGNTFTVPIISDYNIFNGAVNNIRYRLPSDWGTNLEYYPTNINDPVNVYLETGYESASEINCDALPVDNGRDELDDMLLSLKEEIDSLNVELELMVDGGNTQFLNATVVSSIPPQALQVYDELMLKSPNLSDSVMNSSILKETVLNNALLRDILVANPQSAKRDSLMDKLDERLVPMPDTMKAEIMEGIHFLSAKELLEANIMAKRSAERTIFNRLIDSYCQDSIIQNPLDSLKDLFGNDEYLFSKYRLAFSLLKSGEIDAMDTVLNEISSSFTLGGADQVILQKYSILFNVLKQPDSVNIYPWYMNSTQSFILEGLAQDDTILPGALARNMLIAASLLDYMEKLVFLPDSLKSAIANENNGNKPHSGIEETGWIKVFPNPANDYYVIEYMLCDTDYGADRKIEIINIQGEVLEKIPLTKLYDQIIKRCEHYPPGIYVCVLKTGKRKISTSSLIISQ